MAKQKKEVISDRDNEVKEIAKAELEAMLASRIASVKSEEEEKEDADPDNTSEDDEEADKK